MVVPVAGLGAVAIARAKLATNVAVPDCTDRAVGHRSQHRR